MELFPRGCPVSSCAGQINRAVAKATICTRRDGEESKQGKTHVIVAVRTNSYSNIVFSKRWAAQEVDEKDDK